jgi:hypothetical protein
MTSTTHRPAVRRFVCAVLLAAMAAKAHAGALADGYRIAGELYGATFASAVAARKPPRSEPADAVAPPAPAKHPPRRDCTAGAGAAEPAASDSDVAPGAAKRAP